MTGEHYITQGAGRIGSWATEFRDLDTETRPYPVQFNAEASLADAMRWALANLDQAEHVLTILGITSDIDAVNAQAVSGAARHLVRLAAEVLEAAIAAERSRVPAVPAADGVSPAAAPLAAYSTTNRPPHEYDALATRKGALLGASVLYAMQTIRTEASGAPADGEGQIDLSAMLLRDELVSAAAHANPDFLHGFVLAMSTYIRKAEPINEGAVMRRLVEVGLIAPDEAPAAAVVRRRVAREAVKS